MEWYIGNAWSSERKGLRKKVLALEFTELEKPHLVSKVLIKVENVCNLDGRPSAYLANPDKSLELVMGTALTPVDCYLEILVRQLIVGERAECGIQTKKEEITFTLTLERIIESREIHKLTVAEMYALAGQYKENGVKMFKEYPKFAHEYFARAAKCLISYKPFKDLSEKNDGVSGETMEALFRQIQTNLAACLLLEKRYEDVLYQTQFVETAEDASEKSIYRRAVAYESMQEFEKAQKTIERVPNYQEKKDFAKLQQRIKEKWRISNDNYRHLVQKMFSAELKN